MAGKLFIGFDINKSNASLVVYNATSSYLAATVWSWLTFPYGVFHNKGVAALDSVGPYLPNNGGVGQYLLGAAASGVGASYGSSSGWTAASPFRTTFQNAQGFQLGIVRSMAGLTGAELFITFELKLSGFGSGDKTTGYVPSSAWNTVFTWGDVSILMKSHIGSPATSIFSIRNNGVEVATTTLASYTATDWLFCKLRVKLDATTGLIDFTVAGAAQSAPYTGQNTVSVTSLASAAVIYIGPPVMDNGTLLYVGAIDHILFDDSAFPAGRPSTSSFALLADDTLVDMAAFGTGATTVVDALSSVTDAKALRASVADGSAILTQTPPATTTFLTDILGVEVWAKAANRNGTSDRRAQIGYSLSGVQTLGVKARGTPLIYDTAIDPPTPLGQTTHVVEQIFTTSAAAKMTKTELATMKVVIKSSAP